jgi:signal peptidase II
MRRALPWITAVVVLAADRVSKLAVLDHLQEGSLVPVLPGLALSHVHNRGIAFSLFATGGPFSRVVLHLVIVLAVVLIAWMLVRQGGDTALTAVGFGLILGGAIGNLVDRVLWGWVVDFIHLWVRLGQKVYSWPDFNVADSAITVGASLLILHELLSHRTKVSDAPDPD